MNAGKIWNGACFCGATRYRVPDDFAYALICHCSRCRAAST